ncbi:GATA transcription factor 27-like isoform X1 [Hevea brasiliensis]|uniref:GATA transcription factor 27-like isoform X1 n=1 Tax=Hevea brasiliensis TaxID=3981 RepID=UPI0025F56A3D|nr:GATA transcription factor 27-like isoform X1 [Hevea brasiliensis]
MGKQGPCYHCGTNSTPLWRNGPPEKPVLCNACGSMYRIRGSLANYTPKHAQGQPTAKRVRIKSKSAPKKCKLISTEENFSIDVCHSPASDDFTTNKSSSESAISCSQSCYNVKEEENGGESPGGLIQGSLWKSGIPSRKRSVNVQRCLTPIERLQRELCNILKNDPSILSENEEDDLLIYNANNLQVSCNEIGLGGFLLKPNTTTTTITTTTEVPPAEPEKHSSAVDIKDSALIESQSRSSSSMGGFQEN